MAWIELHQSLVRHPKVLRVSAALRVSEEAVIGHMATLWCWALDAKPQGGPLSALDVRAGSNWKARADIATALAEAGFLDERGDGYWLHDWTEYAGRLIRQREMAKQRARRARATNPQSTGAAPDEYAQRTRTVRAEFAPTVPNRTREEQQDDPPLPPHGLAVPETGPPDPAKALTRRLWDVHEELSGRITPPPANDEHQFEQWIRDGLTEADIEAARDEIRAWDTVPEKPWAAFKEALGRMVARRRMGGTDAGGTATVRGTAAPGARDGGAPRSRGARTGPGAFGGGGRGNGRGGVSAAALPRRPSDVAPELIGELG